MDAVRLREAALKELDGATASEDPLDRRKRVEVAAALLTQLAHIDASAGPLALLGYAWYLHPDLATSQLIRDRAVSSLRAAIGVDPHHARAHLYLGHLAYDQERYDEAREEFAAARELGDDFLELKRIEMLVCCAMRIDGVRRSLDELDRFATSLGSRPVEDVHPSNLAKALKDLRSEVRALPPGERRRLMDVAARLDHLGKFTNWLVGCVS